MKLIIRSIHLNAKNNLIKHSTYPIRTFTRTCYASSLPLMILTQPRTTYQFSTLQQKPQQPQKNFKLLQLKQLFQTKMTKYNLKGLLKMYQILKHNNIPLTPQSIKQFDYRLIQQVNLMDHQSTNSILEMSHRNGHTYQARGKNKLLRGINLKLQKNKLQLNVQHVYKTIQLLTEMKFPKSTLSRVLFNLVLQNESAKRMLSQVDNINALKISLIAIENVEIDLQIKKRVLENLLLVKPKGVTELAYYYSVLKLAVNKLQETVLYEAQKKSVYQLAFNPYSMHEVKQQLQQQQTQTKHQQKNNHNNKQPAAQINQTILKRLLQQKEKILQETFQKLNLKKISQEIYNQLNDLVNNPKSDGVLQFKEMKQLSLLLLSNRFGEENQENNFLMRNMIRRVLRQGLSERKKDSSIDSSRIVRVPQFVIFAQEIAPSITKQKLQQWFAKYYQLYYQFMNLQQKLLFNYHKSKLLDQLTNLQHIKQQVTQIQYGLDAQEFVWLHKVLSLNKQKHSQKDQQLVKDIWMHIQSNLDQQIITLRQQKIQQQKRTEQEQTQSHQQKTKEHTNQRNAKDKQHPK